MILTILLIVNTWLAAYGKSVPSAVVTTLHVLIILWYERTLCDYERTNINLNQYDLENAATFIREHNRGIGRDKALQTIASLESPISPYKLTHRRNT